MNKVLSHIRIQIVIFIAFAITCFSQEMLGKRPFNQSNETQKKEGFSQDIKCKCSLEQCIKSQSEETCCLMNKDNFFGENKDFYTSDKIVYVYDFNSNPSQRAFYKICKKGENLHSELININDEKICPGTNVIFKVVNINKFIYDISVKGFEVNYESDQPALLSDFFIGNSSLFGNLVNNFNKFLTISGSNDANNVVGEDSLSNNFIKERIDNPLELIKTEIKCFVLEYNKLQTKMLQAYNLCSKFPCCNDENYFGLVNKLLEIRINTVDIQNNINKIKGIISEKQDFILVCDNNKKARVENQNKIDEFNRKPIQYQTTHKKDKEELLEEMKNLEAKKCDENKYKQNLSEKNKAEEALREINAISDLLSKLPNDQDLRKAVVFLNNMTAHNQTYTLDYIPSNGNSLEINLSIKSKEIITKEFSIPEYMETFNIDIPILPKFLVNFSSGSFITLGNNLQSKTYDWQSVNLSNGVIDDSKYVLTESGYTPVPLGFAALVNFEWKLCKSFGIGPSAGVGITIEKNPRVSYLAGGSMFFGNLHQFGLTCGFAVMPINEIKNNFKAIAEKQIVYLSKPNIEYYNKLKVGAFLSLTYTPFTVSKGN